MISCGLLGVAGFAQDVSLPPSSHPDVSSWDDLFADDLSNAIYPEGIWTFKDGVLTASEDQGIWSQKSYDNFIIDLEFKTASGTNSGVIVYVSDIKDWIPNSVEIQIADDFHYSGPKLPTPGIAEPHLATLPQQEYGQKAWGMESLHYHLHRSQDLCDVEWRTGH